MTSYTESFGIVLIEAMSHGIPCIAFDSAEGAREIINSGENGYLINNRNFDAAVVEAKSIVQHSKNFYTIAISSDVSKMAQLNSQAGGKGNFTANDQQGLKDAFDRIKEEIEGTLGFGANVQDGITGLTK